MSINLESRLSFLRSLEVPPLAARRGLAEAESIPAGPVLRNLMAAAFVDHGSVLSFVEGVSAQHQADALNSLLLAQLAASKKFDRERQIQEWYGMYKSVLENVGWVIQMFDFQKYEAAGSTVRMDKVVLDLLAAIGAGANAVAAVASALTALKSLADEDARLVLWDRAVRLASGGCFQVGSASEGGGKLALKLSAFHFKANRTDTRFLWFGFTGTEASLYKSAQEATLNDGVYANVRAEVAAKLGLRAKVFVANLEL